MLTYTVFQSFTILNEAQSFHPIYLSCEIIAKDNSVIQGKIMTLLLVV